VGIRVIVSVQKPSHHILQTFRQLRMFKIRSCSAIVHFIRNTGWHEKNGHHQKVQSNAHFCARSGTGSGSLELTPAGFCVFIWDPDPAQSQKFVKKGTRIRSHFSNSAVAGVCAVIS